MWGLSFAGTEIFLGGASPPVFTFPVHALPWVVCPIYPKRFMHALHLMMSVPYTTN